MAEVIKIRANDTEPLDLKFGATASAEVTTSDITSVELYVRVDGESTNHVDGVACTNVSASSTDNGDGTWKVSGSCTFNPASNKNGGGDAFDAEGTYLCYELLTFNDGDTTRHPGDGDIKVIVRENFE